MVVPPRYVSSLSVAARGGRILCRALRTRSEPRPMAAIAQGTKICITYGDHDMTITSWHFVCAIAVSPAATKGIRSSGSRMFLVNAEARWAPATTFISLCVDTSSAACFADLHHNDGDHGGASATSSARNRGISLFTIDEPGADPASGSRGAASPDRAYQQALASAHERRQAAPPHRQGRQWFGP